ncbi:LOW QUALITY PROTEIN: piggyBac transposable element-derived protein 4-like [Vespula squamosa]|uniref:PiggyBac transposable element-derived protein 4-like n=1 Tax=Vespula squamosa TaxID=30214 RepID=A0ABD2ATA4_VESSQ
MHYACYKPYENISIDEQLFPTKAQCHFTQYMPNKLHKFGIKCNFASILKQNMYIINGFPYLHKDET